MYLNNFKRENTLVHFRLHSTSLQPIEKALNNINSLLYELFYSRIYRSAFLGFLKNRSHLLIIRTLYSVFLKFVLQKDYVSPFKGK